MCTSRLLMMALLSTVITVGQFRSVESHNGGSVILRHGPVQRVTLVEGDPRYSRIRVAGDRLVIEKCEPDCPRGYRHQVEVVTPEISAVSVSNGGTLQSIGAFPAQAAIEAHVEQGGTLDIRAIPADTVDASVYSGGRIFTNPRQSLKAGVESGGVVMYWGDPRVRKSIRGGGIVAKGTAAEDKMPLSEWCPEALPPIPPVPPVPPMPPQSNDSR